MCFSATASFGAGVLLSVIGTVSIKKVQSSNQIPFAAIPLIFGVQQLTEGFLWLSLTDVSFKSFELPTTFIFLFFAQVVWPFWVPFSILKLEKRDGRKTLLRVLVIIGGLISAYLGYCLMVYPTSAEIMGQHISYLQQYPEALSVYGGVFYILATIAPPFLSSIKRMWVLGPTVLMSYIITAIFYEDYIVSVWCFFASIISVIVLIVIYGNRKNTLTKLAAEE